MSTVNPEIIRWRPIDESTFSNQRRFGTQTPTSALKTAMYRRDGWRCRFCGTPVIIPEARTRMINLLPGCIHWK
ncbi:MAG: hypothetical protein ACRYGI_10575, partial [Janthinobacterium lividum]